MSRIILLISVLAASFVLIAAPAKKKTTPSQSRDRKGAVQHGAVKQTAVKKGASPAKGNKTSKKWVRKAPAPKKYYQMQPAPERYQEIQRALKDRGYYQGNPDGKWDADSTEALKRFQESQKIEGTGKLDSLSLIALGLGPKRGQETQARQP